MIAEVVPPGRCAMVNVSGSRIATPFAPPRPGSTPMMMPSTTPMNISIRLNGDSATPKPWISELSSSTIFPSPEAHGGFERPLGQRHLEPDLEHQEERDAHAEGDRRDLEPGIFPDLPHEVGDEERGGDVEPEILDERDVDHRGHEDGEDELQLAALDERFRGEIGRAQRLN